MLSIDGTWTYRSFLNNSDQNVEPNNLLFGMGTLVLTEATPGELSGSLGGTGWSLDVHGTVSRADQTLIQWQGRGEIGGELWVYDYLGFLVPNWPNGVDQVDAIVGSVIRTEPHSQGQAQAGFSASFYAVRA